MKQPNEELKNPGGRVIKDKDAPKVYSQFNAAGWLLRDITILEEESHNTFLQADITPGKGIFMIYRSVEALQRAFIIYEGMLDEKRRRKLDATFDAFLKKVRDEYMSKRNIQTTDYYLLKTEALNIAKKYFLVKQHLGLNLPVEIARHGKDYIKEVTESP